MGRMMALFYLVLLVFQASNSKRHVLPFPLPLDDQVDNIFKLVKFLSGGNRIEPSFAVDILPYLPSVANEILPDFLQAFTSRLVARSIREVYNID